MAVLKKKHSSISLYFAYIFILIFLTTGIVLAQEILVFNRIDHKPIEKLFTNFNKLLKPQAHQTNQSEDFYYNSVETYSTAIAALWTQYNEPSLLYFNRNISSKVFALGSKIQESFGFPRNSKTNYMEYLLEKTSAITKYIDLTIKKTITRKDSLAEPLSAFELSNDRSKQLLTKLDAIAKNFSDNFMKECKGITEGYVSQKCLDKVTQAIPTSHGYVALKMINLLSEQLPSGCTAVLSVWKDYEKYSIKTFRDNYLSSKNSLLYNAAKAAARCATINNDIEFLQDLDKKFPDDTVITDSIYKITSKTITAFNKLNLANKTVLDYCQSTHFIPNKNFYITQEETQLCYYNKPNAESEYVTSVQQRWCYPAPLGNKIQGYTVLENGSIAVLITQQGPQSVLSYFLQILDPLTGQNIIGSEKNIIAIRPETHPFEKLSIFNFGNEIKIYETYGKMALTLNFDSLNGSLRLLNNVDEKTDFYQLVDFFKDKNLDEETYNNFLELFTLKFRNINYIIKPVSLFNFIFSKPIPTRYRISILTKYFTLARTFNWDFKRTFDPLENYYSKIDTSESFLNDMQNAGLKSVYSEYANQSNFYLNVNIPLEYFVESSSISKTRFGLEIFLSTQYTHSDEFIKFINMEFPKHIENHFFKFSCANQFNVIKIFLSLIDFKVVKEDDSLKIKNTAIQLLNHYLDHCPFFEYNDLHAGYPVSSDYSNYLNALPVIESLAKDQNSLNEILNIKLMNYLSSDRSIELKITALESVHFLFSNDLMERAQAIVLEKLMKTPSDFLNGRFLFQRFFLDQLINSRPLKEEQAVELIEDFFLNNKNADDTVYYRTYLAYSLKYLDLIVQNIKTPELRIKTIDTLLEILERKPSPLLTTSEKDKLDGVFLLKKLREQTH